MEGIGKDERRHPCDIERKRCLVIHRWFPSESKGIDEVTLRCGGDWWVNGG